MSDKLTRKQIENIRRDLCGKRHSNAHHDALARDEINALCDLALSAQREEPTEEMWDAAWSAFGATSFEDLHSKLSIHDIRRLYTVFHKAMLSAAPQAAQQWQPIETAPKDGTDILTCCRNNMSVRYWGEGDDGEMAWQPRIRGEFPTHWMPLPEPPK